MGLHEEGLLVESVFPSLLAERSSEVPLRIWVPGCASGEEVYSMAICLLEFLGERAISTPIQIFGTDVSKTAIEKARAGNYLDNGEISSERLAMTTTRSPSRCAIYASSHAEPDARPAVLAAGSRELP